jgi:hypothetical protein
LAQKVEQDQFLGRIAGTAAVGDVRVSGILGRRDVGRRVADQSLFIEPSRHQLLHVSIRSSSRRRASAGQLLRSAILDAVQLFGCGLV